MCGRRIIEFTTIWLLWFIVPAMASAAHMMPAGVYAATQPVNINQLGIYGDGKTDVSAKLQQAISKYPSLYIPKGHYVLSRRIELTSDRSLTGTAGTVLLNRPDFTDESFLEADSKSNISLSKITFINNATNRPVYAVTLSNACVHIAISQLATRQCGILHTQLPNATYRQMAQTQQKGSSDITVSGCNGLGTSIVTGVYMEYAVNWKVLHSSFTNYRHGVQWWGGDSDPQSDGTLNNPRLTRQGLVANVTVSHATENGIRGSMGEGITVTQCHVNNCGDVGIGFDGCLNSLADNNTVSNCRNGALATFHLNQNIVFGSNTVTQSNPAYPLASIYNTIQSADNHNISFTGNSFTAATGVGIINQHGPAQNIIFSTNKLTNVVLNLSANNNQLLQIDHNTFTISRSSTTYNFIIKAGNTHNSGRVIIEHNNVTNTPMANPNITGIYVTQGDDDTTPLNLISNNVLNGIRKSYKVEWTGQNAAIISKTYIVTSQKLSADAIEKAGLSKSASEVYLNNIKVK